MSPENLEEAAGGRELEPKPSPAPVYNLYLDDTGTRHLDHLARTANQHPRWFALGGFIVAEGDEAACKARFDQFCAAWPAMKSPLHLTDMRARRGDFSWLGTLPAGQEKTFWDEYRQFMIDLPVAGTACVIHRPGYLARGYGSRSGDARWNLCRTAFNIVVERAAKFVQMRGGRLRIKFEGCNRDADQAIKNYFALLKNGYGLGFNPQNSAKYGPLSPTEMTATLIDLERKDKRSKLMQIADTYVYAMAKGRYDPAFDLHKALVGAGRLVSQQVAQDLVATIGVKYYCFEGL